MMTTKDENLYGFALMLTQMSFTQINEFAVGLAGALSIAPDVEIERDVNGYGSVPMDVLRDSFHRWAVREIARRDQVDSPDAIPF